MRKAWESTKEKFLDNITLLTRWGGEAERRQRNHRSGESGKYSTLKIKRGAGVAKRLKETRGKEPLVL